MLSPPCGIDCDKDTGGSRDCVLAPSCSEKILEIIAVPGGELASSVVASQSEVMGIVAVGGTMGETPAAFGEDGNIGPGAPGSGVAAMNGGGTVSAEARNARRKPGSTLDITERILERFVSSQARERTREVEPAAGKQACIPSRCRSPANGRDVVAPPLQQGGRLISDLSGESFEHLRKLLSNKYSKDSQSPFVVTVEKILLQLSRGNLDNRERGATGVLKLGKQLLKHLDLRTFLSDATNFRHSGEDRFCLTFSSFDKANKFVKKTYNKRDSIFLRET